MGSNGATPQVQPRILGSKQGGNGNHFHSIRRYKEDAKTHENDSSRRTQAGQCDTLRWWALLSGRCEPLAVKQDGFIALTLNVLGPNFFPCVIMECRRVK